MSTFDSSCIVVEKVRKKKVLLLSRVRGETEWGEREKEWGEKEVVRKRERLHVPDKVT